MSIYNFSAGPAVLPKTVLARAQQELLDWHGCGMSVMEMSHRGKEFTKILHKTEEDLRLLLSIPRHYHVLFLQGGAIAQNAMIPLNLLRGGSADYVVTGAWSQRSVADAKAYGDIRVVANSERSEFRQIPDVASWTLNPQASYVHVCTNETIHGVEFHTTPDTQNIPLVADMSSHILSRPINVSDYGVIYAGAQKNIGIAGLCILIVREDLLDFASPLTPAVFHWKRQVQEHSMLNTPPTYSIYIAGLVFEWLLEQGGLSVIEQRNLDKANRLYACLDASACYVNQVDKTCRSRMNVPFRLHDESLNAEFLDGAEARGLLYLKGHRMVGGMRASVYNAMPVEGVNALLTYLADFERKHT